MNKFISDARVADGAGIGSFDTLEEAKEIWCFWLSVYEIDEDTWNDLKSKFTVYAELSSHLKEILLQSMSSLNK